MADNLLAPYSYPVSEYTTPAELQQERISQALGWDTSRPGREFAMRALTFGPLGLGPGRSAMPPMRAPAPTLPELMNSRDRARPYNDYEIGVLGHEARFEQMRNAFRDAAAQRREQQPAGPPRQAPEALTQGQRDLYALEPNDMPLTTRPLRDIDRSEAYWSARRSYGAAEGPQSVPPSNVPRRGPARAQRDYHEGPLPNSRYELPPRPVDRVREQQYWRGVNDFREMEPPPRNRMNILLPFAGAGAVPWFVPDERY